MSEEQRTQDSTPRRRSHKLAAVVAGIFGAGLVAGVTIAGLSLAGAQTPDPSPSATPNQEEKAERRPLGKLGGHGPGGFGGRGVLHGEFTTRGPNEGFQTLATQYGDVTAVSASSISVKSEDGFTRTYAVNDDTLVNAGNDGIDDVKTGDDVRIVAVVEDNKARAVQVFDGTKVAELRGKWRPRPPEERKQEGSAQTGANA